MPLYAKLSSGETIPYSKQLIRYEKLTLLGAKIFDGIGKRYQAKGIPYMENEFVDMSSVPDFSLHYPEGIEYYKAISLISFEMFIKTIKQMNKNEEYLDLYDHSKEMLQILESQSHVYCMVRHLIESMARIASLIPYYEQRCEILKKKPPTRYSKFLISAHLAIFNKCEKMDIAVAAIQNRNIPFLYQDLPHIPLDNNWELRK